jgi:prepilin-type N-terminal cleavage/methylation domain-containing protein
MKVMKNIRGFTLIEVLVSTLLIGFAAILSLSIISTLNKNQISTRDNVKYVWVTKSIKSAFNEYLNSVDATSFMVNETVQCTNPNYCSSQYLLESFPFIQNNAKQTLINQICSAECFLGSTKNTVTLALLQSAAKNSTYFYWARVRVINKTANALSPSTPDIYFERLFINQK